MKIIISESKVVDTFQKLIEKEFRYIVNFCDDTDGESQVCEDYESIVDIKISHAEVIDGRYVIFVDIYSDSLRYSEFDNMIYELDYRLGKLLGRTKIKLTHNSTIRVKDHNW